MDHTLSLLPAPTHRRGEVCTCLGLDKGFNSSRCNVSFDISHACSFFCNPSGSAGIFVKSSRNRSASMATSHLPWFRRQTTALGVCPPSSVARSTTPGSERDWTRLTSQLGTGPLLTTSISPSLAAPLNCWLRRASNPCERRRRAHSSSPPLPLLRLFVTAYVHN